MATAERSATINWHGNLTEGHGHLGLNSGAGNFNVTFPKRLGDAEGSTSPEEMIAVANATCYVMGLANMLHSQGNPPEHLEVEAVCGLDKTDAGLKVSSMTIKVNGKVPSMDASSFQELAEKANEACAVSSSMRGNVDFKVETNFQS